MTKQIVVLADAYEAMAQTTGHDHIITDPPYTEHVHANLLAVTKGRDCKEVEAGFDALASYAWVAGAVAATPRWSLFFCALEQLGDYRAACVNGQTYDPGTAPSRALYRRRGNRVRSVRWNGRHRSRVRRAKKKLYRLR